MNLEAHFDYNFALIHTHKWSFTEIENMLPWERDIYLIKMQEWIKEQNIKTEQHNRKMKNGGSTSNRSRYTRS